MTPSSMSSSYESWPDYPPVAAPVEMRMILVAGTDPERMREASMHLFAVGHLPVMAEWFSALDDPGPLSERLLARCDAVLCLDGPSRGGNPLVAVAGSRGLRVFFSLKEALDG